MARQGRVAEEIRTRLELQVIEGNKGKAVEEKDFLDERWMGKPLRLHVKEFACVFAIIMCAIASYFALKHHDLSAALSILAAALVLVALGYKAPKVLHPFWKAWMTFAMFLGSVVTFVILSVGWVLVVSPFAIGSKLAGKRGMDLSFDPKALTYWEPRDKKLDDFKLLERQY